MLLDYCVGACHLFSVGTSMKGVAFKQFLSKYVNKVCYERDKGTFEEAL